MGLSKRTGANMRNAGRESQDLLSGSKSIFHPDFGFRLRNEAEELSSSRWVANSGYP